MGEYLRKKYPHSSFDFVDASIGGTGSKLGIFRLARDVMAYHPDLVFLDFTANDGINGEDPKAITSYEGALLRDMIGAGVPVEQVYLGFKYNFGPSYNLAKVPGYNSHRKLVDPYQTACGDLFAYLQPKLVSGELKIDDLWALNHGKDGAHPDDPGYEVFFEAARQGFEQAIAEKRVCVVPALPVFSDAWHHRTRDVLVTHPLPQGWSREKTFRTSAWFDGLSSRWMGDVAMCDAKDVGHIDRLKVNFTGTLVGFIGEESENGLDFKAYIDGKLLPDTSNAKAPSDVWHFNSKLAKGNLFGWKQLSDRLPPGQHTLEIEPVIVDDAVVPLAAGAPKPPAIKRQLRIESICSAGD